MSNKRKNKLKLQKTQNLSISKDIIKKMNREPIEGEKILANHISNEGLTSRIYKELKTQQ